MEQDDERNIRSLHQQRGRIIYGAHLPRSTHRSILAAAKAARSYGLRPTADASMARYGEPVAFVLRVSDGAQLFQHSAGVNDLANYRWDLADGGSEKCD